MGQYLSEGLMMEISHNPTIGEGRVGDLHEEALPKDREMENGVL